MRNSFIVHIDSLCVLEDLTNEQRGELFYAIYCYQINKEIELSPIVKIAFSQFKNQFSRDEEKYKKTCEARKYSGSLGGKQKVANASNCNQKVANLADSDSKSKNKNKSDSNNDSKSNSNSKSDNDSNKVIDGGITTTLTTPLTTSSNIDKIPYKEIVDYLNNATNSNYRHTTETTKKLIKARISEGFTLEDFKTVIDKKVLLWSKDLNMSAYLRPETLFGNKFESYLNEIISNAKILVSKGIFTEKTAKNLDSMEEWLND